MSRFPNPPPVTLARRIRGTMMRRLPLMVTCDQFDRFIIDFLDNRLPPVQRVKFSVHLLACPDCRAFLRHYRDAIRLGYDAFHTEPALDHAPEGLIRSILKATFDGDPRTELTP